MPSLSWHEQRILREIEADLRADTGLDRSLRTMHIPWPHRVWSALCAVSSAAVAILLSCSLGLATIAPEVSTRSVLAAFGAVWALTALALVGAGGRRVARHRLNRAERRL